MYKCRCGRTFDAGTPGSIAVAHAVKARADNGEMVILCPKCVGAMRVNSTSARRWQVEAAFGLGGVAGSAGPRAWLMYSIAEDGGVTHWLRAHESGHCSRFIVLRNADIPRGTRYSVSMPMEYHDDPDCPQPNAWLDARRAIGKPADWF